MDNFYYLGVVSHHSLEEELGINNCFIVCVFLIETVDWICATMFSWAVWFPDCLPWFNCAHTRDSAMRSRVFGVSVSMDQICEGLFGSISEAQRWPLLYIIYRTTNPDSSPPTLTPPHHDTQTLCIWPSQSNQDPELLICPVILSTLFLLSRSFHSSWVRSYTGKQSIGPEYFWQ